MHPQRPRRRGQSGVGQIAGTSERIGREAVPPTKIGLALAHHPLAARRVAIERRVHHDHPAIGPQHAQRLAERVRARRRVVERRVEDDEVGLRSHEWQALERGLHRRELCPLAVARMRAEAIPVIRQQIDGRNAMPAPRQPMRQPAIPRAEVEDQQRALPRPFERFHHCRD